MNQVAMSMRVNVIVAERILGTMRMPLPERAALLQVRRWRILAGIGKAARGGIIAKGGLYLEKLADIDTIFRQDRYIDDGCPGPLHASGTQYRLVDDSDVYRNH
jgi:hypothetical protein